MTAIGKALAIFIFAVSTCYLAMALLVWKVQIPDWQSKIALLEEYKIVPQYGEQITWVASNTYSKAQVSSDVVLPKVLLACYTDANKKLKADIAKNTQESEATKAAIIKHQESVKTDLEAINKRRDLAFKQLNTIQDQKDKLSSDAAIEVDKAQKIQEEAEKLREDIFRLTQQLDEIKTERRRVKDIQLQLKDLIIRTEGLNQRLLERNLQLKGG